MLKFLVSSGSKLNYRLYGEYLFDILFAGGVLGICIMPILYNLKGFKVLYICEWVISSIKDQTIWKCADTNTV